MPIYTEVHDWTRIGDMVDFDTQEIYMQRYICECGLSVAHYLEDDVVEWSETLYDKWGLISGYVVADIVDERITTCMETPCVVA